MVVGVNQHSGGNMDNQDIEYIKLMAKAEAYEEMAMLLKFDAEHCKLRARSVASNIPMVKASQFTPDVQAEGDRLLKKWGIK